MRHLCLLVMVALVMPRANAAENVRLSPSPLEMPRRIGPLIFDGKPHKFDQPELGVAYQYNADGLSLTIYVYDLGNKSIADGANTAETCEQFEEAKQGVVQANYQGTVLKIEQLVHLSPPDEQPLAREALFEFRINNRPAYSYVWITGVAKNFIKLRFSVDADLKDEVPEARRAILAAFGDAVKPHLLPPDPATEEKEKKPETSIVINSLDSKNAGTAMMYLVLLSAAADKAPEAAPPCGGPLTPSFETELSLFKALLDTDAKSDFGEKLATIDKAGYLDEFVWTDRHLESWGETPPAGLDVGGYKQWRKKNLKKFKIPDMGSVVVKQVRALPVEATDAH